MGRAQPVRWLACEGRNTWDHPMEVPEDMGVEALNVELTNGSLGHKRSGSTAVSIAGDAFSGIVGLFRFVPAQDETVAELWIVSNDGTTKILRVNSTNVAINQTLADNVATSANAVEAVAHHGKLYFAYDTTVNRLHVYSPTETANTIRKVGLKAPAAPSVANTGSGSYPATQRWYRVAWQVQSGGVILRQGEFGPATAFTPSGSGTAARVTEPSAASEGETHWVLAAAAESIDGPYYILATTVVGTTTYDDSASPSTYNINDAIPIEGSGFPFPSTKYLLSDGTRLFGLGVWESTAGDSVAPKPGRVYFTPPIDATDGGDHPQGDDERVQDTLTQSDWIDLNINGGGIDRGLAGPLFNAIYAFQSRGIYQLMPTGQATAPFRRIIVTTRYGAVSQRSIVMGEDEAGNAAIYFLDPVDGPRRIQLGGDIRWLGKDVFDLWQTVNLSATTPPFGLYDHARKTIKWWIPTGASTSPDKIITYNVTLGRTEAQSTDIRYGWAYYTGSLATVKAAVMFQAGLGNPRPLTQCPYVGQTSGTVCARQDGVGNQDFDSTNYQGQVLSKAVGDPVIPRERITDSYLLAKAQSATNIEVAFIKDWGKETRTGTVSLAAGGSEARVSPRVEGLDYADLNAFQIRLGDASAANTTWYLDRFEALVEEQTGAR